MRKPIIIGNWKMNNNRSITESFIKEAETKISTNIDFGIALPFIYLDRAESLANKMIISSQNVNENAKGAFTGEISAEMLNDIHVNHAIIGHSERRAMYNETDEACNAKLIKCLSVNIVPILCCGETLSEYESKQTKKVVEKQLQVALKNVDIHKASSIVIAYEPIWAIGTGKTATPEIAEDVCKHIRHILEGIFSAEIAEKIRIQYGGSVKSNNIKEIINQPNIDGALVGGASVEASSFIELINNAN